MIVAVLILLIIALAELLLLLRKKAPAEPSEGESVRLGREGERLVREALSPLERDGARFIANCYLPKADGELTELDLVMLHRSGIYVLESKNLSGWIFGSENGRLWTQSLPAGKGTHKSRFFNPIMQNRLHITALKSRLGDRKTPIYSYIVFSERCELKKINLTSSDAAVLNRDALLPAIRSRIAESSDALTPYELDELFALLSSSTEIDDEAKKRHIESVERRKSEPTPSEICPYCGSELVLRTSTRGESAGRQFYGCKSFPTCRYTRSIEPVKRAIIFTGGEVFAESLESLGISAGNRTILAADSGYNTAKRLGVEPDLLVGDLDSIDRTKLDDGELERLEKLIVPAIKDDTDTQLAVDTLLERGVRELTIVGGLGGRLDHTLSTVFLLEYISDKGASATITDGRNRVRIMKADGEPQTMRVERGYKYLSLVALSDKCEGVSISGVYYPLENTTLERRYSFAVSNEITSEFAEIKLESGVMLVIESGDR